MQGGEVGGQVGGVVLGYGCVVLGDVVVWVVWCLQVLYESCSIAWRGECAELVFNLPGTLQATLQLPEPDAGR